MRLAARTAAFSARDKHTAYAVLAVNNLSDIAAEILPGRLHVENIIRSALILVLLNVLGHAQQQTFGRGGQHQRIHCVVPIVMDPLAILLLCHPSRCDHLKAPARVGPRRRSRTNSRNETSPTFWPMS